MYEFFFHWLSVDLKTKGTLKQRRRNWDNDDDDDCNDDKRAYSIFLWKMYNVQFVY